MSMMRMRQKVAREAAEEVEQGEVSFFRQAYLSAGAVAVAVSGAGAGAGKSYHIGSVTTFITT